MSHASNKAKKRKRENQEKSQKKKKDSVCVLVWSKERKLWLEAPKKFWELLTAVVANKKTSTT